MLIRDGSELVPLVVRPLRATRRGWGAIHLYQRAAFLTLVVLGADLPDFVPVVVLALRAAGGAGRRGALDEGRASLALMVIHISP